MPHLAADTFRPRNLDLAADIHEWQLAGVGDPGGRLELMVRRADALALGGKLTEAFEVYRQASELDKLEPRHLDNLVDYLSSSMRTRRRGSGTGSGFGDFSCGLCLGFLLEPVTLPCGHSFCKRCLERERARAEQPVVCKECGDSSKGLQSFRVNVVLGHLLAKWFPSWHRAGRLRREGNGLYAERKVEAALETYDQAILTGTHFVVPPCCTAFSCFACFI